MELTIPEPCHEKWHRMSKDEKGRFCMACNKQVIDFSNMTDQQIVDYMVSASGNVCGRFTDTQLNRPLHSNTSGQAAHKWWLSLCFPLFIGITRGMSQGKPVVKYKTHARKTTQRKMPHPGADVLPVYRKINGYVVDEKGSPVALATVRSLAGGTVAVTDTAGVFCVQVPVAEKQMTIVASFERREAQLLWHNEIITVSLVLLPATESCKDNKNVNTAGLEAMLTGHLGGVYIQNKSAGYKIRRFWRWITFRG